MWFDLYHKAKDSGSQCVVYLLTGPDFPLDWVGLNTSTLPSLRDRSKVSSLNYRGILGFLV